MKCQSCGANCPDTSRFCQKCGAPLGGVSVAPQEGTPATGNVPVTGKAASAAAQGDSSTSGPSEPHVGGVPIRQLIVAVSALGILGSLVLPFAVIPGRGTETLAGDLVGAGAGAVVGVVFLLAGPLLAIAFQFLARRAPKAARVLTLVFSTLFLLVEAEGFMLQLGMIGEGYVIGAGQFLLLASYLAIIALSIVATLQARRAR